MSIAAHTSVTVARRQSMPRAQKGVLIECDPTVKQLILKLDEQTNHSIVLEDLDQFRLLVVEPQVGFLKQQLDILLEENTYAAEAADMKDPKKTKGRARE